MPYLQELVLALFLVKEKFGKKDEIFSTKFLTLI
jgi:hypothetical protein